VIDVWCWCMRCCDYFQNELCWFVYDYVVQFQFPYFMVVSSDLWLKYLDRMMVRYLRLSLHLLYVGCS
jgi:hypothetical protein